MPPLGGSTEWPNSEPLGLAYLRGHVVLVNFSTLTCSNWLRQEPHLAAWSRADRDDRLIVTGPTPRSSSSSTGSTASRRRSRSEASTTRSRWTTTMRSGRPSTTTTGRPRSPSSSFSGSQRRDIRRARSSAAPGGAAFAPTRRAPGGNRALHHPHHERFVPLGNTSSGPAAHQERGQPRGALRKLLANPSHWDRYASSRHEVSPGVHGQCRLDALSPELFEPVDSATAQSHLDQ